VTITAIAGMAVRGSVSQGTGDSPIFSSNRLISPTSVA
jgi:hypothetical protein